MEANVASSFDRSVEDVGNILAMEHVNLTVPDQQIAALFYVSALGLTRDPYIDFGVLNFNNMWVNAGEQQFHLPQGKAQRFRGHIGLVVPDLDQLRWRLDRVGRSLKDTQFGWEVYDDHIGVTCPWGNQLRCHAPDDVMALGIRYLDVDVPPDCATSIAHFYQRVFSAPATAEAGTATVSIGTSQLLRFVETDAPLPAYDGHHIAIYVANFSAAHDWLDARSLISEESDQHQYRFVALVDPEHRTPLFELEHEVRSLKHPQFGRRLVNRNSGQTFFTFHRGREAFVP
jgi:hypothetical protein